MNFILPTPSCNIILFFLNTHSQCYNNVMHTLSLSDEEEESWYLADMASIFGSALTEATSTVLQSELSSCQELMELEPDNKCEWKQEGGRMEGGKGRKKKKGRRKEGKKREEGRKGGGKGWKGRKEKGEGRKEKRREGGREGEKGASEEGRKEKGEGAEGKKGREDGRGRKEGKGGREEGKKGSEGRKERNKEGMKEVACSGKSQKFVLTSLLL